MEEPAKLNHTPGPRMQEGLWTEYGKKANANFVIYETAVEDSVIIEWSSKIYRKSFLDEMERWKDLSKS